MDDIRDGLESVVFFFYPDATITGYDEQTKELFFRAYPDDDVIGVCQQQFGKCVLSFNFSDVFTAMIQQTKED